MNKFRRLGFIEYNGGLSVNRSLLTVVLHDGGAVSVEAAHLNQGHRNRSHRRL
jgi:hypothetical protein